MISDDFRQQVERFISSSGVGISEFGRQAVGDPSFILNLRRGRSPTLATADKVLSFIERCEAASAKRARQKKSA